MVLDRPSGRLSHRRIRELPHLLPPSLFVVNDTKVFPARLFARKPSGGSVEILLLERVDDPLSGTEGVRRREVWIALARGTKSLRGGMRLAIDSQAFATILQVGEGGEVQLELDDEGGIGAMIERCGQIPLPHYLRRAPNAIDRERYQTIFAKERSESGSVAAPTAGLHFTPELVAAMKEAGHRSTSVTLHVGPGTFAPLRSERLEDHTMHEERYSISDQAASAIAKARCEGRPIVAIGTTVARALESAAKNSDESGGIEPGTHRTRLFIHPPARFRVVDALVTNFHLPRSTLLALVMALAGIEATRAAYRAAIDERYRFFSYGDAMLIRADVRS